MTLPAELLADHTYRLERDGTDPKRPAGPRHRYACTCGFATTWWDTRIHRDPQEKPNGCPHDPTVRALKTLQFASGGLFDAVPVDYLIHLVRSTNRGTPGPTLCGIDRFAPGTAGWSVGGGVSGGDIKLKPCPGCADAARRDFAGLPVSGLGGKEMADELGVEYKAWGAR